MAPGDEDEMLKAETELDGPGSTEGRKKTGITNVIPVAIICDCDGLIDGSATEGGGGLLIVVIRVTEEPVVLEPADRLVITVWSSVAKFAG